MKLHRDLFFFISWIIIIVCLFIFVYLALLNNRYMYLGSNMMLDKWTAKYYKPEHKENPKTDKTIVIP